MYIRAAHGKVGINTVENTTALLYCDWMHFLWHVINSKIACTLAFVVPISQALYPAIHSFVDCFDVTISHSVIFLHTLLDVRKKKRIDNDVFISPFFKAALQNMNYQTFKWNGS